MKVLKTVFLLSSVLSCTLHAGIVNISGGGAAGVLSNEGLGFFTGTMEYTSSSAIAGKMTVYLKNTSPALNGGYITAFAFNLPTGADITSISLVSTLSSFDTLLASPVSASPFGDFDTGATTKSSWKGGGDPKGGIAAGTNATFEFTFGGTGLNLLTTQNFIDAISSAGGLTGITKTFFAARFRGFDDEGSDKVPGTYDPPREIVPEPSFGLIAVGLLATTVVAARRKRNKQSLQ